MSRFSVCIIGGSGLLGSDVYAAFQRPGWTVYVPSREEVDVLDEDSVRRFLSAKTPQYVINCAAYTDVDRAEEEPDAAFALNTRAPGILASVAAALDCRVVHMSTDFVFDGLSQSPYSEDDVPNPLSVYGRSKCDGENAVLSAHESHIVVRTSWLFGANGKCFPKKILCAARESKPVRVVSDQFGCPTYTVDLAATVINVLSGDAPGGLYHICNSGVTNWCDFAKECLRVAGMSQEPQAILTKDWPAAATRPKYSALSTETYEKLGNPPLPSWQDAVRRFVAELRGKGFFESES